MRTRHIVWREKSVADCESSVADIVQNLEGVEVLRAVDWDAALVMLDPSARLRLQERFPNLVVEPDLQLRLASR